VKRAALFLCVLLLAAPVFAASAPKGELSIGYAFMRDDELKENFPLGWVASAAGNVSDVLGIVGELGGSYKTVTDAGGDVKLSVHTFMAGVRLTAPGSDSARLFLQVLAGAARAGASIADTSASNTNFAVQPGIGVDFKVGEKMFLRLGGDYRRISGESGGSSTNEFRGHVGLVFGLGNR
jgi:opacity protein-like surface antigen